MPSADDARILESTAVRRERMREAFLWGSRRRENAVSDNVKRIAVGLIIAGVIAAGCVGWSLISDMMSKNKQKSGAAEIQVVRTHSPNTAATGWTHSSTTGAAFR